jgi:tetratricopeptide (TPR) repeat protein
LGLSINQYNGLGWDALRNKNYRGAFLFFEKGLMKDSTNLALLENLAHAYLFMGNYNKAIELYKKYRGQNIAPGQGWDAAIKSDFVTLKADGLPAEPMNKVLKELGM